MMYLRVSAQKPSTKWITVCYAISLSMGSKEKVLSNPKHCVVFKRESSSNAPVVSGVSGLFIGPALFLFYIIDNLEGLTLSNVSVKSNADTRKLQDDLHSLVS